MYKTNKVKELYLPNIKIVSESAKINIANYVYKLLDLQQCYNGILFVENADAAVEIVTFVINNLIKEADNIQARNSVKNIITKLFDSYKYHEYSKNALLKKYNIERNKTTHLKYKIAGKTEIYKINNSNKSTNIDPSIKIIAYITAIHAAIMNNNLETTGNFIKYLLENSEKLLDKLYSTNQPQYKNCTQAIATVISMCLKSEFQTEIIMDFKKYWVHDFNILSNFSKILIDNNYYNKTVELLTEPSLPKFSNHNGHLNNCYSHLGFAYHRLENYVEAEEYYLRAFENDKDEDIICNLISIYTNQNERAKLNKFIEKLPTGDLKKLLLMSCDLTSVTDEQLKSINSKELSPYCKEKYEALKYLACINDCNYITDTKIKNDFINFLINCSDYKYAFTLAIYAKEYDTANIIFKKISFKEVNNCIALKYYDLFFNGNYHSKKVTEFIEKFKFSNEEAVEVLNTSSTCLLADKKPDEAAENIKKSLEYKPNNEKTLEIGITTALLNNDKATAKEYANKLSLEKQEEIIESYSYDNKVAENIEELIEYHDPKKIHTYYQLKKKQTLYETSQKIIKNDTNIWWINKGVIKSTDTTFVGKYKGLDCYAKIAENLQLGNHINSYENALKKGILHHAVGGTGIKFIKNNAVELKIPEGERLFTNILHTNDNGKLLIYFDHNGNHNEADKFFRSHHLEYTSNNSVELCGHQPELHFE